MRSSSWKGFPKEVAFEPGPAECLGPGEGMLSLNKSVKERKAKVCLDHRKGSSLAKCRAQSR